VAREEKLSITTLRRPGGASVITARSSAAALGFLTRLNENIFSFAVRKYPRGHDAVSSEMTGVRRSTSSSVVSENRK